MTDLRNTQAVVEVLVSGNPEARLTQAVAEVLVGQAVPLYLTQVALEVLVESGGGEANYPVIFIAT